MRPVRANPCAGRGALAAPAALLSAAPPAVAAPVARPVLMPLWMIVAAVIALLIAIAWFAGTLMTTRRDTSRAVADIPMAPADRREWIARVEACSARFRDGEIDLRALHLELAEILRGFAAARTGEPTESATAMELILDAPEIAKKAKPGNFVILRINESGEHFPLWKIKNERLIYANWLY